MAVDIALAAGRGIARAFDSMSGVGYTLGLQATVYGQLNSSCFTKRQVDMRIDYITCPESIADKLASKHGVTVREARQMLLNEPRFRFAERETSKADAI